MRYQSLKSLLKQRAEKDNCVLCGESLPLRIISIENTHFEISAFFCEKHIKKIKRKVQKK